MTSIQHRMAINREIPAQMKYYHAAVMISNNNVRLSEEKY